MRSANLYFSMVLVLLVAFSNVLIAAPDTKALVDGIISGNPDDSATALEQITSDPQVLFEALPSLLPQLRLSGEAAPPLERARIPMPVNLRTRQEQVLWCVATTIRESLPSETRRQSQAMLLDYAKQLLTEGANGSTPERVLDIVEATTFSGGSIAPEEGYKEVLDFLEPFAANPSLVNGMESEKVLTAVRGVASRVCAGLTDDREATITRLAGVLGEKWAVHTREFVSYCYRANDGPPWPESRYREILAKSEGELLDLLSTPNPLGSLGGGHGVLLAYGRVGRNRANLDACLQLITKEPRHESGLLPIICRPLPETATEAEKASQARLMDFLEWRFKDATDKRRCIEAISRLMIPITGLDDLNKERDRVCSLWSIPTGGRSHIVLDNSPLGY